MVVASASVEEGVPGAERGLCLRGIVVAEVCLLVEVSRGGGRVWGRRVVVRGWLVGRWAYVTVWIGAGL